MTIPRPANGTPRPPVKGRLPLTAAVVTDGPDVTLTPLT